VKRYEVWYGDLYLGIFWEDEVQFLFESGEATDAICMDG